MYGGERGQSELLGTALIIGLTLTGAALVVMFGSDAIDQTRAGATVGEFADGDSVPPHA